MSFVLDIQYITMSFTIGDIDVVTGSTNGRSSWLLGHVTCCPIDITMSLKPLYDIDRGQIHR